MSQRNPSHRFAPQSGSSHDLSSRSNTSPDQPTLSKTKPICPACGSHLVLFRQKDNTFGCRRCGARWDKSKTKE